MEPVGVTCGFASFPLFVIAMWPVLHFYGIVIFLMMFFALINVLGSVGGWLKAIQRPRASPGRGGGGRGKSSRTKERRV